MKIMNYTNYKNLNDMNGLKIAHECYVAITALISV